MDVKRMNKLRLLLTGHKYVPELFAFVKRVSYPLINKGYILTVRVIDRPLGVLNVVISAVPRQLVDKLPFAGYFRDLMYQWGVANRGARCYIVKKLNREAFVKELNRRKIPYVMLRWWEGFPEIPHGEDMDFLMTPEGFKQSKDLITYKKNKNKCDTYLLNGQKPGHWKNLPYFPNPLFTAALNSRVLYNDLIYVPDSRLHFATMAYHAVFHKGEKSGLPGFENTSGAGDHNYRQVLSKLALKAGYHGEIAVSPIVSWLKENGFAPNKDTMAKCIDVNPELDFLYPRRKYDYTRPELSVYVIRETAVKDGLVNHFLEVFKGTGFDILWHGQLNEQQKMVATRHMRGGKWDRASYHTIGGGPETLVVTLDYHPKPMKYEKGSKYNWFDNQNVLKAKQKCRKALAQHKLFRDYNPLHCADNETEALEYLYYVIPGKTNEITEKAERMRKRYKTEYPVLDTLSRGNRSKVELIDYKGRKAVKKTFRAYYQQHFEREMLILDNLGGKYSFIPNLYEKGDGYFIVEYYDNILDYSNVARLKGQLSGHKSQIVDVVKAMYSHGLAYINFTPVNIIITQSGRMVCVDYEFVHRYKDKPETVNQAYEVVGVPRDFLGALPAGFDHRNSSFRMVWGYFLGGWPHVEDSV